MDGGSHDGAGGDTTHLDKFSPSFLADDVDGFAFGEPVLLHGGADFGHEVGDLFF